MKYRNKLALVATTLMLSTTSEANIFKDLLDKFQSINKEEKTECEKMSNNEVASLCAEQVCGPATQHSIFVTKDNIDQFQTEEAKKKIDDLEQTLRTRKENMAKMAETLKSQQDELRSLSADKLSDQDADELLSIIAYDIKKRHNITTKVLSPKATKDGKVKITLPPGSPYAQINKELFSQIDVERNPYYADLFGVRLDNEKMYQKYLETFAMYEQKMKEKNLPLLYEDPDRHELSKNKDRTMFYYSSIIKDAKKYGIDLEEPLCTGSCKQIIAKHLKDFKFFDPISTHNKALEKFDYEDSIALCKSTMAFNNIQSLNDEQIRKEWPKLIDRLKNNTSLKLSEHSKGLLLQKISEELDVEFNAPAAEIKMPDISTGEDSLKSISERTKPSDMLLASLDQKTFKKEVKAPRCRTPSQVGLISDHVRYQKEKDNFKLAVSPFSCEHAHLGKEIMAHELGHAVSFFMAFTPEMSKESLENFRTLRECSRAEKKTSKLGTPLKLQEGDKLTTEEDTADLFSFAVSGDPNNFMGCALLYPDGKEYRMLKMNKIILDTHSSGIQRLMLELQYKNPGKITEACAEVIKRSKSKITNKCF